MPLDIDRFKKNPNILLIGIILAAFAAGFTYGSFDHGSIIKTLEVQNSNLKDRIDEATKLKKENSAKLSEIVKNLNYELQLKSNKYNLLSYDYDDCREVIEQNSNEIEVLVSKVKSLSITVSEQKKSILNVEKKLTNAKQNNQILIEKQKKLKLTINPEEIVPTTELSDNQTIVAINGTLRIETDNAFQEYFASSKDIESSFILRSSDGSVSSFKLVPGQKMAFEHLGRKLVFYFNSARRDGAPPEFPPETPGEISPAHIDKRNFIYSFSIINQPLTL